MHKKKSALLDIIRLESRGFLIDLSRQNAELVPLGLLRRMYPMVLWKTGRSQHGVIAALEILNEQPFNDEAHAIHGALLYQLGRFELAEQAILRCLNINGQCIFGRIMEVLLIMQRGQALGGGKADEYLSSAFDKVSALLDYINEVHHDYLTQYGSGGNHLVHDHSIIDGNLCCDHLVFGLFVNVIFSTKQQNRQCSLYNKKWNNQMEELCKKMLHLKPDSISMKYAVAKVFGIRYTHDHALVSFLLNAAILTVH